MGSITVVVGEVISPQVTQVGLVQYDHLVEALATQGSDEAFHLRILPRGPRRPFDFADAQGVHAHRRAHRDRAASSVGRRPRGTPPRSAGPSTPPSGYQSSHVPVDHASPMVRQDDEDE